MGASSKGCSKRYDEIMQRVVRDPFKDGIMCRSYDDFLIHNHVQPAFREYRQNECESYSYSSSIGQGPDIYCQETVIMD